MKRICVMFLGVAFAAGCTKEPPPPSSTPAPAGPPTGYKGGDPRAGKAGDPRTQKGGDQKPSRASGIFGVRDETQNRLILRDIGLSCKVEDVGKLPNTVDELKAIVKESGKAVRALESGEFVLVPKAKVSAESLFLYERDADTQGNRLVLMGDGSVDKKSAAEFARLQKQASP